MNSVDRWWNRNFPPHSVERLLLFFVIIPIPGLIVFLKLRPMTGNVISWQDYALATGGAMVAVTLGWFSGRMGGLPWATPSNDADEDTVWTPARPARELTVHDVVISWIVLFAGVAALGHAVLPGGLDLASLGSAALVAVPLTGLVAASFSLTILLFAAAAISYPMAALLHMFFFFLSGNEDIWGYWAFSFTMCLLGVMPMWQQAQGLKRARGWADLPLILTSAITSGLLLLAAVSFAGTQEAPATVKTLPITRDAAGFAGPTVGAPTPELAARGLFTAWRMDYRAGGERVADPAAVEALFASEFDSGATFSGCSDLRCTLASPNGDINLQLLREGSLYRVQWVELAATPSP